jgi:hypothetical protein
LEFALKILKSSAENNNFNLEKTYKSFALVYLDKKENDLASKYLKIAFELKLKYNIVRFGENHQFIIDLYNEYGNIFMKLGDINKGMEYLKLS